MRENSHISKIWNFCHTLIDGSYSNDEYLSKPEYPHALFR
jgi:hypothetical protein